MYERQKRILTGLMAGSVLSMSLCVTAHADELDIGDGQSLNAETTSGQAAVLPAESQTSNQTTAPSAEGQSGTQTAAPAAEGQSGNQTTAPSADSQPDNQNATPSAEEQPILSTDTVLSDTVASQSSSTPAASPDQSLTTASTDITTPAGNAPLATASIGSAQMSLLSMSPAAANETISLLSVEAEETQDSDTNKQFVKVGETELPSEGGASDGWNSDTNSGWRYDGTSVSMVNNSTAVEIKAEGQGVDLSVAGVNRISTLYADGDVNITGSGIVLIDSIDLLEGTKLNLKTNTDIYGKDGTGSAAVFLKNDKGEYVLINGSVTGVLDEEYTIPEGVTLVIPEGGTLDMRVVEKVTTTTTVYDGNTDAELSSQTETHYGYNADDDTKSSALSQNGVDENTVNNGVYQKVNTKMTVAYSTPLLNILSGASLKVQNGAKLLMEAYQFSTVIDKFTVSSNHVGTLNVSGTLEMNGEIEAYKENNTYTSKKNFSLNVENDGHVTGSGTMTDVDVLYKTGAGGDSDALTIAGDDSYVEVNEGSTIGSLTVANGNTKVIYDNNANIGSVTVNSGANLGIYGKEVSDRLNLRNQIQSSGTYSIGSGYVYVSDSYANDTLDSKLAKPEYGDFWYEQCPITMQASKEAFAYPSAFSINSNTAAHFKTNSGAIESIAVGAEGATGYNFDDLNSKFGNALQDNPYDPAQLIFEVFTYDGSNVTVHRLNSNSTNTIPLNANGTRIFLVRGFRMKEIPTNQSGSGISSTETTNTGSGILGGANAGSLTGGNSNSVLNGNRKPTPPPTEPPATEPPATEPPATEPPATEPPATEPPVTEPPVTEPSDPPSIPEDNNTGADTVDPVPESKPASSASSYDVVVNVSGSGTTYQISATYDGIELKELGGPVHIAMKAKLNSNWNKDTLFAVFRNAQGKPVAVKVHYNPVTGKLEFDAPMLGEFQLVCLDWDGTDYESEEFLKALMSQMR